MKKGLEQKSAQPGSKLDCKLSQALLDIAAPFLIDLGGTQENIKVFREGLGIAIRVWNATVLDTDLGGTQHMEKLIAAAPEVLRPYLSLISERKRERYPADQRLIGTWELACDERGHLCLKAEIRSKAPVI